MVRNIYGVEFTLIAYTYHSEVHRNWEGPGHTEEHTVREYLVHRWEEADIQEAIKAGCYGVDLPCWQLVRYNPMTGEISNYELTEWHKDLDSVCQEIDNFCFEMSGWDGDFCEYEDNYDVMAGYNCKTDELKPSGDENYLNRFFDAYEDAYHDGKAETLGYYQFYGDSVDENFTEELCRYDNNYFLYCKGNLCSPYSGEDALGGITHGSYFFQLTEEEARDWAELHLSKAECEDIFGSAEKMFKGPKDYCVKVETTYELCDSEETVKFETTQYGSFIRYAEWRALEAEEEFEEDLEEHSVLYRDEEWFKYDGMYYKTMDR